MPTSLWAYLSGIMGNLRASECGYVKSTFLCLDGSLLYSRWQRDKCWFMKEIHIGNLIRDELRRQTRTNTWLAEQIGVTPRTVNKIFSKMVIDTAQLSNISKALNHDFFKYYSDNLNS